MLTSLLGCGCDEKTTHQKTQRDYERLYLGPQFLLDYRYSQILTLVFICFLYSSGLPLLFFTTFTQLMLSYIVDKFMRNNSHSSTANTCFIQCSKSAELQKIMTRISNSKYKILSSMSAFFMWSSLSGSTAIPIYSPKN